MKKIYFLLIICFGFISQASSQQLVSAEYYFDTDPGFNNGIAITFSADSSVSIDSVAINVTGLSKGYHWIYLRVKDSSNVWSHYQKQRFFIYDNSPIISTDTTKLVQAEYWIDTIATPGTGNLIALNPKDTIFYNDSIPGLQLDSGGHVLSLRVKDSKGFWSYIMTDSIRVSHYEMALSVTNSPFVRASIYNKYTINIKNKSSDDINDLFLMIRPYNAGNSIVKFPYHTIGTFSINDTINEIYSDSSYFIPIWIPSLGSNRELKIDYYLKGAFIRNKTIQDQQFEIWHRGLDFENEFNVLGLTSKLMQSIMFHANEGAPLVLDSISQAMYIDSSFKDSLFSFYQNNLSLNHYFYVPHILNASLSSILQINLADSAINILSTEVSNSILSMVNQEKPDSTHVNNINDQTPSFPCDDNPPCDPHTCDPHSPVWESPSFEVNASFCEIRCRGPESKSCTGVKCTDYHGAWDITPKRECITCPREWESSTCEVKAGEFEPCEDAWTKKLFDVLAVYEGLVTEIRPWNGRSPNEGNSVRITTNCPELGTFTLGYFHLSEIYVGEGDWVQKGYPVGRVGNTGTDYTHIHISVFNSDGEAVNPRCYFKGPFGVDVVPLNLNRNANNPCKECIDCKGATKGNKNCSARIKSICAAPTTVGGSDPNDKVGNEGFAPQRFIKATDELHYGIFFENVDSATAPAQIVKIIDTLDLLKVDPSTFKLESVTAGEMLVVIPDSVHLNSIDTIYQAEAINGTFVDIKQSLDTTTGIIQFTLSSLDTINLQPVTGALEGFLPPDTSKFHGSGLVSYRIMPRANIPTGTIVYNTAHIVFDTNPSIATGKWFNTIDGASPASNVNALAPETHDTNFVVSWSGIDVGAGISGYDVYYKTLNDTVYTKWLNYTTATVDTFQGQWDSTYEFYSIAYDSVGNSEQVPINFDAATKLTQLPLPISIKNFFLNEYNCSAFLSWTTSQESNTSHIDIYRTSNGVSAFQKIATVQSAGQSSQEKMYSYIDKDVKDNTSYEYQLQFVDINGKFSISDTKTITLDCSNANSSIHVFPNPAKNELNVLYVTESNNAEIEIAIFDLTGRNIISKTQSLKNGGNLITLDISKLSNGIYFLHYKDIDSMESGSVKFEKR